MNDVSAQPSRRLLPRQRELARRQILHGPNHRPSVGGRGRLRRHPSQGCLHVCETGRVKPRKCLQYGSIFSGMLVAGRFNGTGNYTWTDGRTYKGHWKNGKREGTVSYRVCPTETRGEILSVTSRPKFYLAKVESKQRPN